MYCCHVVEIDRSQCIHSPVFSVFSEYNNLMMMMMEEEEEEDDALLNKQKTEIA